MAGEEAAATTKSAASDLKRTDRLCRSLDPIVFSNDPLHNLLPREKVRRPLGGVSFDSRALGLLFSGM